MSFLKSSLIIPILLLACKVLISQNNFVELQGTVVTADNKPAHNSNLQVKFKTGEVIAFLNTGDNNKYFFKISWQRPDTLIVTISHIGYEPQNLSIYAETPTRYINEVVLEKKSVVLDEVTVSANAIRKNGDTTFYNADSFTEPGQKKLVDLIQSIPGFTITASGDLFYYNKPIQKLTIGGQEIFAENIQLLLKNFPIHIIKTVQALENQNLNPMLKGLTNDHKVTVNIGLKEDLDNLFGDAEAGLGTGKRYLLNPVLFGLSSDLKLGYIGNLNSYGKSTGPEDEL